MRHIVTVTHQRRTLGHDRWHTEGLRIFGPFYTPFTARDFARKVGRGAIRVRWTMHTEVSLMEDKGVIVLTRGDQRAIIASQAMSPSSIRAAWKFIRDWFGDKPITSSRTRRERA